MSAYTSEEYAQDKEALDAARNVLSALVVGEKIAQCESYEPDYARIATYFARFNPISKALHNGEAVRRVARTFLTLAQAPQIDGFQCNEFERTLSEVDKMLKSKRTFSRRQPKKCLQPGVHKQPCFCGNLARAKAKMDEPVSAEASKTNSVSMLDAEEANLRQQLLEGSF